MNIVVAIALGLLCLPACGQDGHQLELEGRTFSMGEPILLDLEGETLLLWMNVDDNCYAARANDFTTRNDEDLVIIRYWGLPAAPGRLDGLSLSADVFFPDADIDPSVTYGSRDDLDFVEVLPRSSDTWLLRFHLTFVAASENETLRWLDDPVVFEGEQVAGACPR